MVLVGAGFLLVTSPVLLSLLGPPPILVGSGRLKLNSKVPPTVRVCGACLGAFDELALDWIRLCPPGLP